MTDIYFGAEKAGDCDRMRGCTSVNTGLQWHGFWAVSVKKRKGAFPFRFFVFSFGVQSQRHFQFWMKYSPPE